MRVYHLNLNVAIPTWVDWDAWQAWDDSSKFSVKINLVKRGDNNEGILYISKIEKI